MARNVLYVGSTPGKRWHGWRTTARAAPVKVKVPVNAKVKGRGKGGQAKGTIRPSQIHRITIYATEHSFDVPAMTGWSAVSAENFYARMETMVAEDIYTDE